MAINEQSPTPGQESPVSASTKVNHLLLTPAEAAKLLGIGKERTKKLVYSGELPSVLIGKKHRRVPLMAIEAFLRRAIEQEA